ncbi:MAG: ATP-binding cassette domain-containing protein [Pirellulaceae bacterium]
MSSDSPSNTAVKIESLAFAYGDRQALCELSLEIHSGEIFCLLGPNGSGKTTLFRLLSTLAPLQAGCVSVMGNDLVDDSDAIRRLLGVVFQSPSLDRKLTVLENLRHQAAMYGLSKAVATQRLNEATRRLGITDRLDDRVETLSGGLSRRVELAKCMLHNPSILLLDEPSTGLDPAARSDLWSYLRLLQSELGTTVLMTTHLLEEADRSDRVGILHEGSLVALGEPHVLRTELGSDVVSIQCNNPTDVIDQLQSSWQLTARELDGMVRLEESVSAEVLSEIMQSLSGHVKNISVGRPTLEDVFIHHTGHQFWHDTEAGR